MLWLVTESLFSLALPHHLEDLVSLGRYTGSRLSEQRIKQTHSQSRKND